MIVRNWLVGAIAVTALIGLGSYVMNNPTGLIKQVIFTAIIVAGIYMVVRIWTKRKSGNNDGRAFAKAAKHSKKRYQPTGKKITANGHKKPLRRRSAAHLTVIEGKKSKKKDRAIF